MLRVFTAFSGYDSQCMALDRAGISYDLVGWSEIDRYAIAAHNAVYPQYSARNFGDISKIDWEQVPAFDLFTYSSPCQDFSTAGLMRGGDKGSGTRSSLLWECERAIVAKRPKYLLFENVSSLASEKFIGTFNQWQLTLERIGYTNFTQIINAKDYGVPQYRKRLFMVSVFDCDKPFYYPDTMPLTKCLRDVLEDNVAEEYYLSDRVIDVFNRHAERHKKGGWAWRPTDGRGIAKPVLTDSTRNNFNFINIGDSVRKLTPTECFRLMGVSDNESAKICAVVSKTQAYKLAGNSIVVDVLARIFSQLFVCNTNKIQQKIIY